MALVLLDAQRCQANDSRLRSHENLKVAGGAAPKPLLCRGLCLRRRPLALGQRCLALADSS